MQMALDTEEACAHYVRVTDPWLIDNQVKDQVTMEERKLV